VSFIRTHGEKHSAHGNSSYEWPRLSTTDPELSPSLAEVQRTIDDHIEKNTSVSGCRDECWIHDSCEITRNDGEFLSFACVHEFDFREWRSGDSRRSWNFRRQGKRFVPLPLQALARNPSASLLFRLLPQADIDKDVPLSDEEEMPGCYVALHQDDFEIGSTLPFDSMPRGFRPYTSLGHHLTCDALLDMPSGAPASVPAETGAMAVATRVTEDDDPLVTSYWGGAISTMEYPVFTALEPRHVSAAHMLNAEVQGFMTKLHERAKAETWRNVDGHCHGYSSTPRLISLLCYGGGNTADGDTRTARASLTLRLTDPPERITGDEIINQNPNAPAKIAKVCLGRFVHKAKDKDDEVLPALPTLKASELRDFSLWQGGMMFAVEYDMNGNHKLMPCYVPNDSVGTNLEMLSLPAKKKR